MSVRVKICGITRVEDAEAAIALGAEMVGLNFYPPSPRNVTFERAREIRRAIGRRCQLIGVFVNATDAYIEELMDELDFDMIQFHGDEDNRILARWRRKTRVIRALRLKPDSIPDFASVYGDYVLLDTFHPELYGGTGRERSLQSLKGRNLDRVLISGGLTPENVAEAAALHPYAVDVASGVEAAPGIKDHVKLRSFIANAKSAR